MQCRCVETGYASQATARLDSSKGRCRRRSELSVTAARVRKVRAKPPETKGKGKVKDKNKHKSNDGDKNKERDNWNRSATSASPGLLSHIARSGATNAQFCRTRLAQQKNGAVAGVQEAESEADGVKAAQWSDVDSDGTDVDSSSWCFAALNTPNGLAGTLLVDSGADDHICHPDFAKEFPLKKNAGLTLRDVQGKPLTHHGTRHVNLSVGARGQRANIDFQIADTSDNILSLGKLSRNGFVFNFRRENDSIMYHHRDPTTTVPLFLHKNNLRIRAKPDCTSCDSGAGARHSCATVCSITVEIAGSSFE